MIQTFLEFKQQNINGVDPEKLTYLLQLVEAWSKAIAQYVFEEFLPNNITLTLPKQSLNISNLLKKFSKKSDPNKYVIPYYLVLNRPLLAIESEYQADPKAQKKSIRPIVLNRRSQSKTQPNAVNQRDIPLSHSSKLPSSRLEDEPFKLIKEVEPHDNLVMEVEPLSPSNEFSKTILNPAKPKVKSNKNSLLQKRVFEPANNIPVQGEKESKKTFVISEHVRAAHGRSYKLDFIKNNEFRLFQLTEESSRCLKLDETNAIILLPKDKKPKDILGNNIYFKDCKKTDLLCVLKRKRGFIRTQQMVKCFKLDKVLYEQLTDISNKTDRKDKGVPLSSELKQELFSKLEKQQFFVQGTICNETNGKKLLTIKKVDVDALHKNFIPQERVLEEEKNGSLIQANSLNVMGFFAPSSQKVNLKELSDHNQSKPKLLSNNADGSDSSDEICKADDEYVIPKRKKVEASVQNELKSNQNSIQEEENKDIRDRAFQN